MAEQHRVDLLESLCLAPGPPGGEDAVRRVVHRALGESGSIVHDRLGSVVCEVAGTDDSVRVVLDSHLDEAKVIAARFQEILGEEDLDRLLEILAKLDEL